MQYLSEANDVQTWLNEKKQLAASEDYGRAETVADKLLTKHKVINSVRISKMFVYRTILKKIGIFIYMMYNI